MKPSTLREDFFVIFVSFWSTILLARFFSFEFYRIFGYYPVFYIWGIPVHNFIVGLILVALVLSIRIFKNIFNVVSFIVLGVGLALVADELWLITTGNFTISSIYWAGQNLSVIVTLGILSFIIMKFLGRNRKDEAKPEGLVHINPPKPHITVVVPALNEEKYLDNCLSSLASQTYKNFELIVVDNNSEDRTQEIAAKYGARVIFNSKIGVGAARQAGFMEARGAIIATTDADNVLPPDWVEHIAHVFDKDRRMVAYGGLFRLYSGPLTARIAVRHLGHSMFKLDRIFSGGWSLIAQNMAVRKSAFVKIGGFKDVRLGEDADLSQRLRSVGKVVLNPDFIVWASGRRVRHGLWYGVWTYAPNGFTRMFFKKHKFDTLPTVREEQSLLTKLSFIPLLASIIYLVILFSSMNSTMADAREELVERQQANIEKLKDFTGSLPRIVITEIPRYTFPLLETPRIQ